MIDALIGLGYEIECIDQKYVAYYTNGHYIELERVPQIPFRPHTEELQGTDNWETEDWEEVDIF